MRTPSLRRRVTLGGFAIFILLVLLLDVFVYVTLRARLDDTLGEVLTTRADLARELDGLVEGPEELADRLAASGVPAVVTATDGRRFDTGPVTRFDTGPPAPPGVQRAGRIAQVVELDSGGTAEVFASRGGVQSTLRRFVLVTSLGTLLASLAAVLLFRRAAAVAIAPLDQVVAAARRTAAGHSGQRLEPDDPTTELGRFATAYDRMLDALEDALADTRRTEERTRRFLDDAAHQLRTPLATVRASAEALLREHDPEVRDLLMASLVREVARADRQLTSLLTLARLDGGQEPARAPTDLVALARDEVERCRSIAPHLEVHVVPSDPAPPRLDLDADAIREVLANLLDNARRHAEGRIEVRVAPEDDGVTAVRVADDGPGIAPEQVDVVFERFASLDGRGGSGLGLAIGRAIADNHGGSLTYEDRVFVLRLPTPAVAAHRSDQA